MVMLGKENNNQDNFLKTPLFDVNMRLFNSSSDYRKLIRQVAEYMNRLLCTQFQNYTSLKGISGANIGVPYNIIGFKDSRDIPVVMINPKILHASEKTKIVSSNCGSLLLDKPVKVKRSVKLKITFFNLVGDSETIEYSAPQAFTIAHEIDHNNGITILDRAKELTKEEEE